MRAGQQRDESLPFIAGDRQLLNVGKRDRESELFLPKCAPWRRWTGLRYRNAISGGAAEYVALGLKSLGNPVLMGMSREWCSWRSWSACGFPALLLHALA
jgi:hypothetical protein